MVCVLVFAWKILHNGVEKRRIRVYDRDNFLHPAGKQFRLTDRISSGRGYLEVIMASFTTLLIGMFALFAFWLGHSLFDSYVVAILFLVIAVITGKALQPVILTLWYKFLNKYFPLPELHPLYSKGFDEPAAPDAAPASMLGMRVLAMTEDLDGKKNKESYKAAVTEAIGKLCSEFDLFKLRYEAVLRRNSPVEWLWVNCGAEGENMNRCFKAWMESPNVYQMKARQQNRDMFLHDGIVNAQDGTPVRYTVMVLFDSSLPVTLPAKEEKKETE